MRRFSFKYAIRSIAIALIILPEPTTTFLGVILLAVTFIFGQQKPLRKFGDLDSLARRSLRRNRQVGYRRLFSAEPSFHTLKTLEQDTPARMGAGIPVAPAVQHDWFDNRRVSDSVILHTLRTSFPQYQAGSPSMGKGSFQPDFLTSAGIPVQHHKLRLDPGN